MSYSVMRTNVNRVRPVERLKRKLKRCHPVYTAGFEEAIRIVEMMACEPPIKRKKTPTGTRNARGGK